MLHQQIFFEYFFEVENFWLKSLKYFYSLKMSIIIVPQEINIICCYKAGLREGLEKCKKNHLLKFLDLKYFQSAED